MTQTHQGDPLSKEWGQKNGQRSWKWEHSGFYRNVTSIRELSTTIALSIGFPVSAFLQ